MAPANPYSGKRLSRVGQRTRRHARRLPRCPACEDRRDRCRKCLKATTDYSYKPCRGCGKKNYRRWDLCHDCGGGGKPGGKKSPPFVGERLAVYRVRAWLNVPLFAGPRGRE